MEVGGCSFSDWARWEARLEREGNEETWLAEFCHAYTIWPAPSLPIKMNNVRDIEMEKDCDGKIYHDGICCMMALCQEDNGDGG